MKSRVPGIIHLSIMFLCIMHHAVCVLMHHHARCIRQHIFMHHDTCIMYSCIIHHASSIMHHVFRHHASCIHASHYAFMYHDHASRIHSASSCIMLSFNHALCIMYACIMHHSEHLCTPVGLVDWMFYGFLLGVPPLG
jgi:hypothetical protein